MSVRNDQTIGGSQQGGGDLISRMREAHDQAAAEGKKAAAAGREVSGTGIGSADRGESPVADGLEKKLVDTARRVLQDELGHPSDVRETIVDTIVEERYGEMAEDSDGGQIVETVKDVLKDDVAFGAEVDNMLVQAARRLGRADASDE